VKKRNKPEQKRTVIKKRAFISGLQEKAGNISKACEAAGIGRTAFYEWLAKDKAFAARFNEVNEAIIDWGEDALKAQMQKGDTTAIIFFLKTKGKARGYVERQEIEPIGEMKFRVIYEKSRKEQNANHD